MKPRIQIIGNLVKDAENFVNRFNQKQCKFLVAVNTDNQNNGYYIDCFLNTHLTEEQLPFYKKGNLCSFTGKYSESLNTKGDTTYFNRSLTISEFNSSNVKNSFNRNMTINFVGYLMDKPVFEDDKTVFVLTENIFTGEGENKQFRCVIPYILSDKKLAEFKEDCAVFVFGFYVDFLYQGVDLYINRTIDVKDFDVLFQPQNNILKIGDITM